MARGPRGLARAQHPPCTQTSADTDDPGFGFGRSITAERIAATKRAIGVGLLRTVIRSRTSRTADRLAMRSMGRACLLSRRSGGSSTSGARRTRDDRRVRSIRRDRTGRSPLGSPRSGGVVSPPDLSRRLPDRPAAGGALVDDAARRVRARANAHASRLAAARGLADVDLLLHGAASFDSPLASGATGGGGGAGVGDGLAKSLWCSCVVDDAARTSIGSQPAARYCAYTSARYHDEG